MKRIPLKAAAAATFFAVVVSFLTLASAGAQGYGTKQPGPVPCDCSNCSAEHCPKPKGSKSFPKQIFIESWGFGSSSAKGATGLRSNQK